MKNAETDAPPPTLNMERDAQACSQCISLPFTEGSQTAMTEQATPFFDTALPAAFVLPPGFKGQRVPVLWVNGGDWPSAAQIHQRLFAIGEQADLVEQSDLARGLWRGLHLLDLRLRTAPQRLFLPGGTRRPGHLTAVPPASCAAYGMLHSSRAGPGFHRVADALPK